jgi:hypothetical protein
MNKMKEVAKLLGVELGEESNPCEERYDSTSEEETLMFRRKKTYQEAIKRMRELWWLDETD